MPESQETGTRTWQTVFHSVRGALATIGATAIAAEIAELEAALRQKLPLAALAERAAASHERLSTLAAKVEVELAR